MLNNMLTLFKWEHKNKIIQQVFIDNNTFKITCPSLLSRDKKSWQMAFDLLNLILIQYCV